jgi:hypothetical protein
MEHRPFDISFTPMPKRKPFRYINNYLLDDFQRYRESQQRDLDELVDQGVLSETDVDDFKRQGEAYE